MRGFFISAIILQEGSPRVYPGFLDIGFSLRTETTKDEGFLFARGQAFGAGLPRALK